jgi:hypothetical protein
MRYVVYMLASGRHGTLYVGVTNDLPRRVYEHKAKIIKSFTSQYDVNRRCRTMCDPYHPFWRVVFMDSGLACGDPE